MEFDEAGEILRVGGIYPRQAAGLLEADVVPVFVLDALLHCGLVLFGLVFRTVGDFPVRVARRIVPHVVVMRLQRASGDVQVAYDGLDSGSFEKFPQILFYGVL